LALTSFFTLKPVAVKPPKGLLGVSALLFNKGSLFALNQSLPGLLYKLIIFLENYNRAGR
jgi:hypothetical protein